MEGVDGRAARDDRRPCRAARRGRVDLDPSPCVQRRRHGHGHRLQHAQRVLCGRACDHGGRVRVAPGGDRGVPGRDGRRPVCGRAGRDDAVGHGGRVEDERAAVPAGRQPDRRRVLGRAQVRGGLCARGRGRTGRHRAVAGGPEPVRAAVPDRGRAPGGLHRRGRAGDAHVYQRGPARCLSRGQQP